MKFNLEKLKDPEITEAFQDEEEENTDTETLINNFNNAMTETASVVLGKQRHKKKLWITTELLDMCDRRRSLKKGKNCPGRADKYREINKEKWIGVQCRKREDNLYKNNSKRAFQVVTDLKREKKGRISTIQNKSGDYQSMD